MSNWKVKYEGKIYDIRVINFWLEYAIICPEGELHHGFRVNFNEIEILPQ